MLHKQPKLFQDPGIDYPIYDLNLDFQDYIKQSKSIIAHNRQDLASHTPGEQIISSNAPFELKPSHPPQAGVLLIHGLLDSPFTLRDIGEHLRAQGLLVRSIMLPGHGTVPGALLNTDYTEWLQAVRYGVATLKTEVEKIYLVGFSTGASLALYHAAQDPFINGIIMLAPAIRIASLFTFTANWHRLISATWKRAEWFYLNKEIDYTKYTSITFNSIYQVYRLTLEIKKLAIKKLVSPALAHCPIFMILSQEDAIVCSRASLAFFKKISNPLNRLLMYSSEPLSYHDPRITVRRSLYPDMNITSFSHISLPIAPTNSHYGKAGDYPLASRLDSTIKYGAVAKADYFYARLLHQLKLNPHHYQCLTFNPDFDFLKTAITKFIF